MTVNQLKNFNWRKEYRNRRYLLWAVGAVFLAIVMVLAVVLPSSGQIFSLQQQYRDDQKTLLALRKKAATLDQVHTLPVYRDAAHINQVMPSKKPVFEMLAGLNEAGSQAQLALTDIELSPGLVATESAQTKPASARGRPAAKKKRTDVDTFTIKLTVRGSLDQINRFLELINQVAPLTNVTQTELNLGGKSVLAKLGIKTDFEADIVLETYFFTQPILSTVDSPLPEVSGQEETVITELNNFIYQSAVQPDQVFGGGLQDLFGVEELQFLESIQTGEATTSPRQ